jgi:hypothetical protein
MTAKPESLQEALKAAQQIVDSGDDISYPSRSAANHVRRVMANLIEFIPVIFEECAELAESFGTEESNQIAEAIRIVAGAKAAPKKMTPPREEIYVKWPHGGWLRWNWDHRRWDHVDERSA